MPVTRQQLTQTYAQYITTYPSEAQRLSLVNALLLYSQEEPADPATIPAHVVARGVLLGPDRSVLAYPVGQRLAFPGGHTASDDTVLMDTARRALADVTTLPAAAFTALPLQAATPLDYQEEETIDGHLHRVFLFLFALAAEQEKSIKHIGERVNDFRWVPVEEFAPQERLYGKLQRVTARCL